MKLLRFGRRNRAHWGVLVTESLIYDLTVADFSLPARLEDFLASDGLDRAREMSRDYINAPDGALVRLGEVHLLPPITPPCNFICVGKNYADHAKETGSAVPEFPMYFTKASTAAVGAYDPIRIPAGSFLIDYEAELAFVIGRTARQVPVERALEYVAGYTIVNDVSERHLQYRDKQFFRGKSLDTFAPTGPWLVTPDELPDPQKLDIICRVDGQVRQESTTAAMVFGVAALIADLTRHITLYPGDIVATGTPPGVALGHAPELPGRIIKGEWEAIRDLPETKAALEWYLRPGQHVECEVQGIGTLRNPVRAWEE